MNTAANWVSFSEKGVCLFCGIRDIMYKYFQINNSPHGIFNIANKLMINRKIITRCRVKDRILCYTCYERLIYCDHFVDNIQNLKKSPIEVNHKENEAICCICRKAHEKPLKSISINGFLNNRELFLTTLLFDIKTTKEDRRIACKSCYNNMVILCNLHRLICITHPELRSILNRSNINELKEDLTFKETIILDDKIAKTKTRASTSAINYVGSSKSTGKQSASILSENTDSSSSSILGTPILGGESMFDFSHIGSLPSYKFVKSKSSNTHGHSADTYANADSLITDHVYHVPKPLKQSQPRGTHISLPSHTEDEQSYEIQQIILSQTEIDVPPKSRKPNRFIRFWRRVFNRK